VGDLLPALLGVNRMKACVQRVTSARVTVNREVMGQIERGLVVLLGVGRQDERTDADFLAQKLVGLRIFEDEQGKMNRSLIEADGAMLVVSQFTLWGDCRKGRRPSFVEAAPPEQAEALYAYFVKAVEQLGVRVATGQFRAHMEVALVNDGPVTLNVESR
jgi:D-tyrosyl-tRNA(Tyr) deacylase